MHMQRQLEVRISSWSLLGSCNQLACLPCNYLHLLIATDDLIELAWRHHFTGSHSPDFLADLPRGGMVTNTADKGLRNGSRPPAHGFSYLAEITPIHCICAS
jgi:hypothetical protein